MASFCHAAEAPLSFVPQSKKSCLVFYHPSFGYELKHCALSPHHCYLPSQKLSDHHLLGTGSVFSHNQDLFQCNRNPQVSRIYWLTMNCNWYNHSTKVLSNLIPLSYYDQCIVPCLYSMHQGQQVIFHQYQILSNLQQCLISAAFQLVHRFHTEQRAFC